MAIREDPTDYKDKASYAQVTINQEHHKVHEGDHYFIGDFDQINAGASLLFGVETEESNEVVHMLFEFESTGAILFEVYEDCTYDTSASVVNANNSDRNSSNVSSASIQKCASVTNFGTRLFRQKIGVAETPVKSVGGDARAAHEMVLRIGTKYVYRFESFSASNIISYFSGFYHLNPKEVE